ncbi:MAG: hypothetical protein MHMPM18_001259 [Marteilia pararefringens]
MLTVCCSEECFQIVSTNPEKYFTTKVSNIKLQCRIALICKIDVERNDEIINRIGNRLYKILDTDKSFKIIDLPQFFEGANINVESLDETDSSIIDEALKNLNEEISNSNFILLDCTENIRIFDILCKSELECEEFILISDDKKIEKDEDEQTVLKTAEEFLIDKNINLSKLRLDIEGLDDNQIDEIISNHIEICLTRKHRPAAIRIDDELPKIIEANLMNLNQREANEGTKIEHIFDIESILETNINNHGENIEESIQDSEFDSDSNENDIEVSNEEYSNHYHNPKAFHSLMIKNSLELLWTDFNYICLSRPHSGLFCATSYYLDGILETADKRFSTFYENKIYYFCGEKHCEEFLKRPEEITMQLETMEEAPDIIFLASRTNQSCDRICDNLTSLSGKDYSIIYFDQMLKLFVENDLSTDYNFDDHIPESVIKTFDELLDIQIENGELSKLNEVIFADNSKFRRIFYNFKDDRNLIEVYTQYISKHEERNHEIIARYCKQILHDIFKSQKNVIVIGYPKNVSDIEIFQSLKLSPKLILYDQNRPENWQEDLQALIAISRKVFEDQIKKIEETDKENSDASDNQYFDEISFRKSLLKHLESDYESIINSLDLCKEFCADNRITNISIQKWNESIALQKASNYLNLNFNHFQYVSVQNAFILISSGYARLSKYGMFCPVELSRKRFNLPKINEKTISIYDRGEILFLKNRENFLEYKNTNNKMRDFDEAKNHNYSEISKILNSLNILVIGIDDEKIERISRDISSEFNLKFINLKTRFDGNSNLNEIKENRAGLSSLEASMNDKLLEGHSLSSREQDFWIEEKLSELESQLYGAVFQILPNEAIDIEEILCRCNKSLDALVILNGNSLGKYSIDDDILPEDYSDIPRMTAQIESIKKYFFTISTVNIIELSADQSLWNIKQLIKNKMQDILERKNIKNPGEDSTISNKPEFQNKNETGIESDNSCITNEETFRSKTLLDGLPFEGYMEMIFSRKLADTLLLVSEKRPLNSLQYEKSSILTWISQFFKATNPKSNESKRQESREIIIKLERFAELTQIVSTEGFIERLRENSSIDDNVFKDLKTLVFG